MIDEIRNLVFGLGVYPKTRIDYRFLHIKKLVPQVVINSVREFEILEEIIYKIKDELRLKSSNINKTIKNPAQNLTKKNVREIVEKLEKIKYESLKRAAFSSHTPTPPLEVPSKTNTTQTSLFKTLKFEILFCFEKTPNYISIEFSDFVELSVVKIVSSVYFDVLSLQGTTIIIEKNTALIVGRTLNDNFLELPKIEDNLNETFKLLKNEETEPIFSPPENYKENAKLEIYRDDTITTYLDENFKNRGKMHIELLNSKLQIKDISYLFIFSKIFSKILFDEVSAKSTFLLFDFATHKLSITPILEDIAFERVLPRQKIDEDKLSHNKELLLNSMKRELPKPEKEIQETPQKKAISKLIKSLKRMP